MFQKIRQMGNERKATAEALRKKSYKRKIEGERRNFESGLKQGYDNAKIEDGVFVRHTARKIDEILEYEISPFDKTLLIKYYMNDWRNK